jgi:alginate O-acetyltransferase complex protein AlgI
MVFNSFSFAIFLPIVFLLYWLVFNKTYKTQNALLLIAGIVFYSLADWRFISLIAISGIVNFYLTKSIAKKEDESNSRRVMFYVGIFFNIGILLYFKYFNFFIEGFVTLFNYNDAVNLSFTPFHILLPLGISFFTFQMIGYIIDVNNEEAEPINDFLSFFTYLLYFPKILSGPIERIQEFIPQIQKKREFDYTLAIDGLRQFLWGLFKKMVIANKLTVFVNLIFDDYQHMSGNTLLIGAVFYSFSLYADFSGYSDMACGVSKMFNIRITNNFSFPFFSTNISDFWKKWHISLTSWMMNYVYTPLSFLTRKYKKYGLIISITLTFLLVGLWHGPYLTYLAFGVYHGFLFTLLLISSSSLQKKQLRINKFGLPSFVDFFKMMRTFLLVSLGMIIFRSESIESAISYMSEIFSSSLFNNPIEEIKKISIGADIIYVSLILVGFVLFEWLQRDKEHALQFNDKKTNVMMRWSIYYLFVYLIVVFQGGQQSFIYVQF